MAASASEKYLDVESVCVLGQFPTCITDAITRAGGEQLLLHIVLFSIKNCQPQKISTDCEKLTFSQDSHFQKLKFCKIHIFKN